MARQRLLLRERVVAEIAEHSLRGVRVNLQVHLKTAECLVEFAAQVALEVPFGVVVLLVAEQLVAGGKVLRARRACEDVVGANKVLATSFTLRRSFDHKLAGFLVEYCFGVDSLHVSVHVVLLRELFETDRAAELFGGRVHASVPLQLRLRVEPSTAHLADFLLELGMCEEMPLEAWIVGEWLRADCADQSGSLPVQGLEVLVQ